MNKKELQKEIEDLSKMAKIAYRKDGYISTALFFKTIFNDGKKMTGGLALPNEAIPFRFEIVKGLGSSIKEDPKVKDVEAVLMISEVFISEAKKGEKEIAPSKDPNAKEGVIIIGLTQEGEQAVSILKIKKKKWWREGSLVKTTQTKNWKKIEQPLLAEFWKGYKQVNTA